MRFSLWLLFANCGYGEARMLRQQSSLNLSHWIQGRPADGHHLLQMSIALSIQNAELGEEMLLGVSDPTSSNYGQHLSAVDVARLFEPKPNALPKVLDWLEDSGIDRSNVKLSYGRGHVSLKLSVHQATSLLQAEFHLQTHQPSGQALITCSDYHVPEHLSESIDYILAVSKIQTHQRIARDQIVLDEKMGSQNHPLPSGCLGQTRPECLRSLYGIPDDVPPHAQNSFGVFQPSWQTWLAEDLDKFFGQWHKDLVGQRPKVDAINEGYLQRNCTGVRYNLEPDLDFAYAMSLTSPQQVTDVQVGSYWSIGNLHDMLAAFDEYYCDPSNDSNHKVPLGYGSGCNATACDCGSTSPPKVLSVSWGWPEAGFDPRYLQRQCLEFLKLGLMGTTVVVGAPDYGTSSGGFPSCLGNDTHPIFSPGFPSSCPWVTSVGGTQILQSRDGKLSETAFRQTVKGKTDMSSGGGFSNVFLAPPYQISSVALYQESEHDHLNGFREHFNSTGRGFPDVAARANDYQIVVNGSWMLASGNSASAPVFASIITLINSERMHKNKASVGFINPVLYANPDVLNDVVTGANEGCGVDQAFRAVSGWDAVTGLGSPDYERMLNLFMRLP